MKPLHPVYLAVTRKVTEQQKRRLQWVSLQKTLFRIGLTENGKGGKATPDNEVHLHSRRKSSNTDDIKGLSRAADSPVCFAFDEEKYDQDQACFYWHPPDNYHLNDSCNSHTCVFLHSGDASPTRMPVKPTCQRMRNRNKKHTVVALRGRKENTPNSKLAATSQDGTSGRNRARTPKAHEPMRK